LVLLRNLHGKELAMFPADSADRNPMRAQIESLVAQLRLAVAGDAFTADEVTSLEARLVYLRAQDGCETD
jgi:hypothetical protein